MNKFSEIVLLTKSAYYYDLKEWLEHHINLGFDHITVYDNESPVNLENLCKQYTNVTYNKIEGWPDQLNLELLHYQKTEYEWVYFGDDDEFLWIDPKKYSNINDFIKKKSNAFKCDNIAVRWVKVSANPCPEDRPDTEATTQRKIFNYIPEIEPDSWVKCFYKKGQYIRRMECHFCTPLGITVEVSGKIFLPENVRILNYDYKDDDCLIYHYFFRSWNEFKKKLNSQYAPRNCLYKDECKFNIVNYEQYLKMQYVMNKRHKLHCILIVKANILEDFKLWLRWYIKFINCDYIYIIDDGSSINLVTAIQPYKDKIKIFRKSELLEGKENIDNEQVCCYNEIIFNHSNIEYDDYIITPDIDEFWWYDYNRYKTFINCISARFVNIKSSVYLVASILMGSKNYMTKRETGWNYTDFMKYRCNLQSCEHKPILRFNGHGFTNIHYGQNEHDYMDELYKWSDDFGSHVLYNNSLRLYHYRFTTEKEYNEKIKHSLIKTEIVDDKRWFFNNKFSNCMDMYSVRARDKRELLYNIEELTVNNTIKTFLQ